MGEGKKNQLHQLLAVEPDLRNKAAKILVEAKSTFSKKADHFDGHTKLYEAFEESGDDDRRSNKVPSDIKEIVTTVAEKLDYVTKSVAPAIDAQVSKEETNTSGIVRAELTVGEKSFGEWSAQSLMALESFLLKIRDVFNSIPTLDPVRQWVPDPTQKDVYKTEATVSYRTEKRPKVITLAPATKEHPAQSQLINIDKQVGEFKTSYNSGRITPKQKSEYLGKVDKLITAIKSARSRANRAEIVNKKIGKLIFNYLLGQ